MSVMINTSLGDLVIDLHIEDCPLACKNFLKLCKIKYYNNCLFHTVQKDFIVQTGDPTGTGEGGDSIYKFLYGEQARFFQDEIHVKSKHEKVGTVGMASAGEDLNASQFYITTREELDSLDGKHTIFGEVVEGLDTLQRINDAYVDGKGRPYKNIRIKHTYILEDPFEDPPQLVDLIPESSPLLQPQEGGDVRLEDDWVPMDEQLEPEEVEKTIRKREAHSRAVVLEMIGDIPEAEMKPPENVLFVCKLNPVTQDEDLEIIFSRFGKVISADIIRDYKTGDSLCYGFIEFESQEACEAAYFKMDNVLIDDRRIHVDFSQSVAKLWTRFRRFGTKDEGDKDENQGSKLADKQTYQLKDTGGQRGGTGRRYEMVFDDDVNNGTERRNRLNSQERHDKLADEVKRVKEGHEERRFKDRRHEDNGRGGDYKSKEKQRDRKRDSPETKYATKHGDKDSRESRKRNIDEADGIRRDRSEHRYSKSYDDRGYRESRSHSHHNRSRSPRDKASNDRRESYKRAYERERAEAHRR